MLGAGDTELIGHNSCPQEVLSLLEGKASKKAVVMRVLGWGSTKKHQTGLRSEKPSWRRRYFSWDECATEESQHNESRA